MKIHFLIIPALALALASCGGNKENPFHPEALSNQQWQLQRYSAGIGQTIPIEGNSITLRFEGDTLMGNAGCNEYFGSWEYRGHDYIAVSGQIGTTEMFCEGLMKQEWLYLKLLSGVSTFIVNDTLLQLSGEPGMLVFAPVPKDGDAPEPAPVLLTGYFMAGNEVSIFRDCADTTVVYWLEDETQTLDSLYQATTKGQEYQPAYLEIDARKWPPSRLGYASEYDGLIKVYRIRSIALPEPEETCLKGLDWG